MEIEKLRLFAGTARKITAEDIAALVPDAQPSTIFRIESRRWDEGDRKRALEIPRPRFLQGAGEYMPLALTFLATQFQNGSGSSAKGGRAGRGADSGTLSISLGARMWPEAGPANRADHGGFSEGPPAAGC